MDQSAVKNRSNQKTLINFRDSIVLTLALLPGKFTRRQFYASYLKVYLKLKDLDLVSFNYPQFTQMILILQKLARKGLIQEEYSDQQYVISLSEVGIGAFEVLEDSLETKAILPRVYNLFQHLSSPS